MKRKTGKPGPDAIVGTEELWALRTRAGVMIQKPVHLSHPTPHPERTFTRKPRKHCGGCPFSEGCVVCTLD